MPPKKPPKPKPAGIGGASGASVPPDRRKPGRIRGPGRPELVVPSTKPKPGGKPTFEIPPPESTGTPTEEKTLAALNRYTKGRFQKWIPLMKQAAKRWSTSASYIFLVLIREGGSATTDPNEKGAIGLAQIKDTSVDAGLNPRRFQEFIAQFGGPTITPQMAADPTFAIHYLAWRMSYGVSIWGDLDTWYSANAADGKPRGYNPNYTGPPITTPLNKAGVPDYTPTIPATPTAPPTEPLQDEIYGRWVVRNPNGTIGFQKITDPNVPPKNIVYQYGKRKDGSPLGAPLKQSDLLRTKATWDDVFISYTGKPATFRQITNFLESGVSQGGLLTTLSKAPAFRSSPIWRRYASGIIGAGKELFGRDWKPDMELVRKAIVESWESETLKENLRNRPEYLRGPVYKGKVASFNNIYTDIYGVPNNPGRVTINEAAFQDWDENTFASWLRGQPEYTKSPEYQAKVIGFLDQMGLITGSVPTLQPGKAPANPMKSVAALPNAPQVAGKPTTPRTTSPTGDLVPRLGG